MEKSAVARALVRELQGMVELDQSLGSEFVAATLPPQPDLTQPYGSPAESRDDGALPAQNRQERPQQPAAPSRGAGSLKAIADSIGEVAERRGAGSAYGATPAFELGVAAGVDMPPFTDTPPVENKIEAISPMEAAALKCRNCKLCEGRNNVVFGEGSLDADIVFVGEAPGRDEDRMGRPFVGRAGVLLTAMIEKGMKIPRDSVYICNILKCRPPRNRDPEPDEVRSCTPYLHVQLNIIRPKLIIALGRISAQILAGERMSMRRLRGRFFRYRGIPLLPIYHPAYLLRARERAGGKTEEDRQTWSDLQAAMAMLKKS